MDRVRINWERQGYIDRAAKYRSEKGRTRQSRTGVHRTTSHAWPWPPKQWASFLGRLLGGGVPSYIIGSRSKWKGKNSTSPPPPPLGHYCTCIYKPGVVTEETHTQASYSSDKKKKQQQLWILRWKCRLIRLWWRSVYHHSTSQFCDLVVYVKPTRDSVTFPLVIVIGKLSYHQEFLVQPKWKIFVFLQ